MTPVVAPRKLKVDRIVDSEYLVRILKIECLGPGLLETRERPPLKTEIGENLDSMILDLIENRDCFSS